MSPYPNLETFLTLPKSEVRKIVPSTVIYNPNNTRRSAVLSGIATEGRPYVEWTHQQLMNVASLLFDYGVSHLFMLLLAPSHFSEVTPNYHEHLWQWINHYLAGDKAITFYQEKGWRVRFLFHHVMPQLHEVGQKVEAATAPNSQQTVWYIVPPTADIPKLWLLQRLSTCAPQTIQEALACLYEDDIKPADLFISTGKPVMPANLLPPFLTDKLHCYWSQLAILNESEWRTILHDYAYLRQTWLPDKTGRAQAALQYRRYWQQNPILGVGTRLGPHWYPKEITLK